MKLGRVIIESLVQSDIWQVYKKDRKLTVSELKINPNSVDVTLHEDFLIPLTKTVVDPLVDTISYAKHTGEFILMPGAFVLGAVNERFVCSKPIYIEQFSQMVRCAPMYEGRSTVARIGVASHISAGFGDVGFNGAFTLELYNHAPYPVKLTPGMRIGQVAFDVIVRPGVYDGAYAVEHDDGPVAPVLGKDRF